MKKSLFLLLILFLCVPAYAQEASDFEIEEVTVVQRKKGKVKSRTETFDTEKINSEELCRAACCNLSEAFETNASVDVAYSDAATGAKQIRLLGLGGTYVQLIQENTPAVRGLAQNFGLEYIPGPWMSSIQVSKGTSSVINGYEATSGQINVELLKPQTQNPLSVNLMFNSEVMGEVNIMGGWQIPLEHEEHVHHHEHGEPHDHCHHESLYTGILAHYTGSYMPMDGNKDGFVDMPLVQNANLANRWFYKHGDYTMQAFVRGLYDRRRAGQIGHITNNMANPYLINLNTWRVEGFLKNGYVYDEESGSSVALITAVSYHDLKNRYGNRAWTANQLNVYVNGIWQRNWEGRGEVDNDHRLSAGVSVNFDKYNEQFAYNPAWMPAILDRNEVTPGIFAEYSYKYDTQLSIVAGVRGDYSTRYGFFCTPRANVRYMPFEWWTIRASAGMGYRSPNVIADNSFVLPSTRDPHLGGYEQERAVNTGVSTTFYIPMGSKELQLSAEYYYTHFINSTIVDMDRDPNAVYFYNQSEIPGAKSFAHSAQIEASMEVLRGWTWTAAFRYTDVEQTTFSTELNDYVLRPKALTNRFKGIISTSYQTPLKKWQFDVTMQFNGPGRMPDGVVYDGYQFSQVGQYPRLSANGQYYTDKNGTYHKWYPQLMAQITKYFRTCSLYVGAENMTNFRQNHPIAGWYDEQGHVQTDMPFEASSVWGPTAGWKVYVGFRYDLEKSED